MQGFDWYKYAVGGAASRPDSFSKLNPEYAARVAQMLSAADQELGQGSLKITSAYRSPDLQAKLYADAVKKYGSPEAARKWVAPPGKSKHNAGLAVDFAAAGGGLLRDPNSREAKWIKANAGRFGLDVPMSWEPWQVELPRNGVTSGGSGNDTLAGQQGQDDLTDLDAFMGFTSPAQQPQQTQQAPAFALPEATVAQDYAATGALDPVQMQGLDLDAFMGLTPQVPRMDAAAALPVDAMTLPAGADPTRDQLTGVIDELGNQERITPFGTRYTVAASAGPQRPQGGYLRAMGRAVAADPLGAIGGAAQAVGQGIVDMASVPAQAAMGQAPTYGDVLGVASMSQMRVNPRGVASDVPGAPATAAGRIEPPVTAPVAAAGPTMQDVQSLLSRAQKGGRGSRSAIRELARQAKINPETAAAAERLGIDLPADVFSDSIAVQEVAGAIRGVKTGEAAAEFLEGIKAAQGKATEAFAALDNGNSIAEVSEGVLSNLRGTQRTLKESASELYEAIDAKVPKSTPVETNATASILSQTLEELGGMSRMTPQERALTTAITNPEEPLTYAGLVRMKQDIGRALERGQGPYADVNQATLKRLYGGLAEDQLAAVESLGGADLRKGLEAANSLTAQRKELEKSIVGAFGKDLEGSIATKLTTAVKQASKGDLGNLNRMLNVIPKELQRETVATAISDIATTKRGSAPGMFSFEEYAKTYQGLRSNPPVYNRIVEVMGPDGHALMEDLYRVSAAVSRAKAAIPMTGKANQITQSGALGAEGLISRVMNTTTGRTAARASTTAAGGLAGGIPGAIAADAVGAALTMGKKDAVQAAGKLLSSDEFKRLAVEAATKTAVSETAKRGVLMSPSFRRFMRVTAIENPEAWLNAAILGNAAMKEGE
jgi:hypothetical protein